MWDDADAGWMTLKHVQADFYHFKSICPCGGHDDPPVRSPQAAFILHHLETDQDVACIVDLTFELSLTSILTLRLLLCKRSSSVLLHPCQLSEDRPRWPTAHPGWGLVPLHQLLRLRRDHLGLQERWRALLPNGSRERRSQLQNRAEQPHNQCFDIMARELEVHGGVSVQRSPH